MWIRNTIYSGSIPCCLRIFGNYKNKRILNQKEKSTNYLTFSISLYTVQKYSPESTGLKLEVNFKSSTLSFLPDPKQIISDQDPGKSPGSDRIRIHNTVKKLGKNVLSLR